jgi:uncharacterized protein (DUF302 family)
MAGAGVLTLLFPNINSAAMNKDPQGIISNQSRYSVKETMDRLENILKSRGVTVFSRIDQQAEAAKVGLALDPIVLIIFGNPKAGTPLMQAVPLCALDLPLKALAWQDKEKNVWLSYNSAEYLQQRFSLPEGLIKNISIGPVIESALQ